jgi:hypothetical protein
MLTPSEPPLDDAQTTGDLVTLTDRVRKPVREKPVRETCSLVRELVFCLTLNPVYGCFPLFSREGFEFRHIWHIRQSWLS